MLIMNLLVPITMIGFGGYFIKNGPKEINMLFGYRTNMSMKNKDTWIFAHNYCGKLWRFIGWIMLPLSICAMIYVFGKEINDVGIFGVMIAIIQMILLVVPIIPTEIALNKNFDKSGCRKIKTK